MSNHIRKWPKQIHVVEHSAYEAVREELHRAVDLCNEMAKTLESIKATIEANATDTLWCHDELNMTAVEKLEHQLEEYAKVLGGQNE